MRLLCLFFVSLVLCIFFLNNLFIFVLVILTLSQTVASPVTCELSCQDEARKEDVVVVMTGREDVEEEEGEEKPTEEGGK